MELDCLKLRHLGQVLAVRQDQQTRVVSSAGRVETTPANLSFKDFVGQRVKADLDQSSHSPATPQC